MWLGKMVLGDEILPLYTLNLPFRVFRVAIVTKQGLDDINMWLINFTFYAICYDFITTCYISKVEIV